MKKIFVLLLVFVLLLTGCNTKGKNTLEPDGKEFLESDGRGRPESSIKGRYVEKDSALPEEFDKSTALQLTKKDGMPFLYAFSFDGSVKITGYQMNTDGSWTENTPGWLKPDSLPKEEIYEPEVFEDGQGNQYLYYLIIKEGVYNGKLLCSRDGTTYEVIVLESRDDGREGMFRDAPKKMTALPDGTLVALLLSGDVIFYDKDDYTIKESIIGENYSQTILSVMDKSIVLGMMDHREKLVGIDIYDTDDYRKVTYPYQSDFSGYSDTYFDRNDKKEMTLCDGGGIHILEEGTSVWQTVVDGDMTSLAMRTMYASGFAAASDSNYYILYSSQNGYFLMKYSYDETVFAVPSSELNVYSLKDSPTLRHAAALFRLSHPDIKVSFNIIMTDEEYRMADQAVKDDYIRSLNTELLAGGGPDILVLDDLPAASLIEKGALADISDIIQPMLDKGELYPDIMKNYQQDDKIYYVPARFVPQLLCARASNAEQLSTMESLAEYMAKNKEQTLFGKMTYEDFINIFAPYLAGKITNADGGINKDELVVQLEVLKSIGDNIGIIDEYIGEEKYINNDMNLAGKIGLVFSKPRDFNDAVVPLGMVKLVDGSYTVFENSFIPACEVGINQASKSKELSKEFISLLLSEEVQKEDFFEGFAVNKKAMDLSVQKEQGDYGFAIGIEGENGEMETTFFESLNSEQKKELAGRYARISNRITNSGAMITFLKEEIKEFIEGSQSAEEAANAVMERAYIYLAE